MAPSKSRVALAALVLGTVLGQAPLAADAATVELKTDACLNALNLARAGRLDKRLKTLDKDGGKEKSAKGLLEDGSHVYTKVATSCNVDATPKTPEEMKGLLILKAFQEGVDDPVTAETCPKLIQEVIDAGLKAVPADKASTEKYVVGSEPYKAEAAQNFAYMLWSGATKVGCVATKGCKDGKDALFCQFDENPKTTEPVFTKEFYDALKARDDAKVYVTSMKPEDVNKPLTSSVAAIVPSALVMGATALIGFASM